MNSTKMPSKNIVRSLEVTFGKIPKIIEENMKYLSYNGSHFTCNPCDKIIKKVGDLASITTNFEKHLTSRAHKKYTIINDNLLMNLKVTFSGQIPPIVQSNFHVLGMDGGDYKCVICKKILTVNTNPSITETNFSYHLLSGGHEKKLEDYRETLSQLHEVYGGIPRFVLNHSQFLKESGKHYICEICEKQIQVHPSDLNETEKSFEKHLHSLKHLRNAKEARAFSLYPELKQIFYHLPHYMLRNIEYISINGHNFFCSLCNENIKFNLHNMFETKENFILHISSQDHEENLDKRRDPNNEVFYLLQSLFEDLPDSVLKNLKYLSINGEDFYCRCCEETIIDDEDNDVTRDNLIVHFESFHQNNVNIEMERQSTLLDDLEDVFDTIPDLIEDNIDHIDFKGVNKFECTLCDKFMMSKNNSDDYEYNTSVTEENFESHLNSNKHQEELQSLKDLDEDLQESLENLFSPVPQFITNNLKHLGYNDDKTNDDFHCFLCDKTIALVNGNKSSELTEQNFRTHLLSAGHMAKLKHKANLKMEASEQLKSIFCSVPNFVLTNIEHIESQDNRFFCTLCDAQIMRGDSEITEGKFREHLFGARHKSNLKAIEERNETALQRLDSSFWRIPEFLLRNIDFLNTYGDGDDDDDLFCLLCQETLIVDGNDLEDTKNNLRSHIESKQHQSNLKSM